MVKLGGRRAAWGGVWVGVALLAGCSASPSPSPPVGGSASPSTSPGVETLDLTTTPFAVLDSPIAGDDGLTVGFADGRVTLKLTLKRELHRWNSFSSMTAGRIAYSVADPDKTAVHVITVA